MKNDYGNLRYWLWTLLPALNLLAFYAMVWRGVAVGAGRIGAHDALYEGLRTTHGYLMFGLVFSVGVWSLLTFAASRRLSRHALRLHAGVYAGGWAANLLLLVTDPGRLLYWWMG